MTAPGACGGGLAGEGRGAGGGGEGVCGGGEWGPRAQSTGSVAFASAHHHEGLGRLSRVRGLRYCA